MTLYRQPAQRPIPVERAVRWLPLDDPFYMLATVLVSAKAEPLVVPREVLVTVETRLREGAEDEALGVLYGANYFCSKTRIAYLLVEGVEHAPVPSRQHDRDAEMAAELRALARRVEASGKLVIGWYHGGAELAPRIGLREIALHLAVCSEPWQVALLRSGTEPNAARRGAFARVEPTERRVYPVPFVEVLPQASRDPAARSSAVSWTNYRSETAVPILPDSAFRPSRVSGPVSSRSRLSLLGALHGLIGGGSAPESSAAAEEPPTAAASIASGDEPQRPSRARPFTPPAASRGATAPPPEREVAIMGGETGPADAAPAPEPPPPVLPSSRPAADAALEASAGAPAGGAPPPAPNAPSAQRDERVPETPAPEPAAATSAAPAEPDALDEDASDGAEPVAPDEPVRTGERAVEIAPLPLADAPPPREAPDADEPPVEAAPDAAAEHDTANTQDLLYPALLSAPSTLDEMPVDIARLFEPAPDAALEPEPEPDLAAGAPSSPLSGYLRTLQRSRVRARLVAGIVVVLGLAGAAALFARQRTRDVPGPTAPETRPVSADTTRARHDTTVPAGKGHVDASDPGAGAMQGYARSRLAGETTALAADVASLGGALQVVLGPAPRTSTDSLRRSMACARADSARTDAIMHGQAVQLARRYLTTPTDAPALARAAALIARADTLATSLLSPCPPQS